MYRWPVHPSSSLHYRPVDPEFKTIEGLCVDRGAQQHIDPPPPLRRTDHTKERLSCLILVHRRNTTSIALLTSPATYSRRLEDGTGQLTEHGPLPDADMVEHTSSVDHHGSYDLPSWELTDDEGEQFGMLSTMSNHVVSDSSKSSIEQLRRKLCRILDTWSSSPTNTDETHVHKMERLLELSEAGSGPVVWSESRSACVGDYCGSMWRVGRHSPLVPCLPSAVTHPYAVHHLFLVSFVGRMVLPIPHSASLKILALEDVPFVGNPRFPIGLRGLSHILSRYRFTHLTYSLPPLQQNGMLSLEPITLDEEDIMEE